MGSLWTTTKSSSHSPQLEKAGTKQQRPSAVKNKLKNNLKHFYIYHQFSNSIVLKHPFNTSAWINTKSLLFLVFSLNSPSFDSADTQLHHYMSSLHILITDVPHASHFLACCHSLQHYFCLNFWLVQYFPNSGSFPFFLQSLVPHPALQPHSHDHTLDPVIEQL